MRLKSFCGAFNTPSKFLNELFTDAQPSSSTPFELVLGRGGAAKVGADALSAHTIAHQPTLAMNSPQIVFTGVDGFSAIW